jgi:nicotinamidase-related amidase
MIMRHVDLTYTLGIVLTMVLAELGFSVEAQLTDGKFVLQLREQVATTAGAQTTKPVVRTERWNPGQTAVIVCDMWDSHHCYNSVQRVKDMAGRMNEVLKAARGAGALIIHCPSSCMRTYDGHPARIRAQHAPAAENLPDQIGQWCLRIPSEENIRYPIDQSDGGEDDSPEVHRKWHEQLAAQGKNPLSPWSRQYDPLEIHDEDAITDSGVEVWNLLGEREIENVMLLGVHTNMCVLGQPFGLRQMAKNGKNVVLIRDLTDTMYNPSMPPYVHHHTGTDFIIEYIEKCVCPTVSSSDLIGGKPHRFFDDKRPTLAVVISEFEYETFQTLPEFARQHLGKDFRVVYVINDDPNCHELPGIEVLKDADVAILSIWRRTLPPGQLQVVRDYTAAKKPLVAIRTTSHAFATRNNSTPQGRATWQRFDRDVLQGNYDGHHGNHTDQGDSATVVWVPSSARENLLVAGVPSGEFTVGSWLYKMAPLGDLATPVLMGRVGNSSREPVAWSVNTDDGQRVFYTSLGSQDDFGQPEFVGLLHNAIYWAAGLPRPAKLFATTAEKE